MQYPPGIIRRKKSIFLLFWLLFIFITSCEKIYQEPDKTILNQQSVNIESFSVLPVDLAEYNMLASTKSENTGAGFVIDSLLKWENEEQVYLQDKSVLLRQIPLKLNNAYCSITHGVNYQNSIDSLTDIKSYLIIVENFISKEKIEYVASMFPMYSGDGYNNECTFLKKGNFTGLIIYSNKLGDFLRIEHFYKGLLINGKLLKSQNINDYSNVMYISVYSPILTRSGDGGDTGEEGGDDDALNGGELTPIYVLPTTPTPEEGESRENDEDGGGGSPILPPMPPGGGGGGNNGTGGNYDSGVIYNVSATVAFYCAGFGRVTGSGNYTAGSTVKIFSIPNWEYKFSSWNQSFSGMPDSFSFQIEKDMSGEATFKLIDICSDILNNKSNPLRNMKLIPPNGSMVAAATYGNTRHDRFGNIKFHNGVDLYAPLGSPIYSMFTGTVNKVIYNQVNKVFGGLDRNKDTMWVYPDGYNGNTNGAGNRIYIMTSINGDNVNIGYWHLQSQEEGNGPIAVNPRTGQPYKTGDIVYQGEIIGYVGYTGNASKNTPHLHLNMSKNGQKENPANYLNAIISTTTTDIVLLNCVNSSNNQ